MKNEIFTPRLDYVLLKEQEAGETVTSGGIIKPASTKEKPDRAEIVAVGPGRLDSNGKLIPTGLKPGQQVAFMKYSGTTLTINEKDFRLLRADEVLGTFSEG